MQSLSYRLLPLCGAAAIAAGSVVRLVAQEERPAATTAPLSLTAAADSVADLDAKVIKLEKQLATLGESLAAANRDATSTKEDNDRLRLQMETLGIVSLKPELRPLQERLISALNDYRLAEKEKQALAGRLLALSEASLALLSDPADPNGRKRLQEELATANQGFLAASQSSQSPPVAIDAAKVISLKSDLGLAVINTGHDSGLRSGTPMRIVRADQTVATGLVVDVRNRIAGVLLTSAGSQNSIKVGDSAKPETTQTTLQK